jgi:Xaa-Pro aminopeptidase
MPKVTQEQVNAAREALDRFFGAEFQDGFDAMMNAPDDRKEAALGALADLFATKSEEEIRSATKARKILEQGARQGLRAQTPEERVREALGLR